MKNIIIIVGLFLIGCEDTREPDCGSCGLDVYAVNLQAIGDGHYTLEYDEGNAKVMFGAWEPFIGYTVTVYCGYTDLCGVLHQDSLKITIVNEE